MVFSIHIIQVLINTKKFSDDAKGTAVFCRLVNGWFDLVNERHVYGGLDKDSQYKLAELKEVVY